MPDNAPPKWMFRNMSEIHDNTERILELLDGREESADEERHHTHFNEVMR